jgi:hypothetical protein
MELGAKMRVLILVAVYKPNLILLENFVTSLRNQIYSDWTCKFYVDGVAENLELENLKLDSRFSVIQRPENLGSYKNYATAITDNLTSADYIFLADQDDVWLPTKISTFLNFFAADKKISLLYSDAQVVDSHGNIINDSLNDFEGRKVPAHWQDLIIKNAVSGTTMAISTSHFDSGFYFPESGGWYHDLWIALVAIANGNIHYIPSAEMQYVQHAENTIGAIKKRFFPRISFRALIHSYKIRYKLFEEFRDYLALQGHNLIRYNQIRNHWKCGSAPKRSLISLHLGESIVRIYRVRIIRIFIVISRIAYLFSVGLLRNPERIQHLRNQLVYLLGEAESPNVRIMSEREFGKSFKSKVRKNQTPRYLVVLPALEEPIFGGTATALKIAGTLASEGKNVSLATINRPVNINPDLIPNIASQLHLNPTILHNLIKSSESMRLEIGKDDVVIPTAWWTCEEVIKFKNSFDLNNSKILYLVQDFEPLFYPASENYARALMTYEAELSFLINSFPLADYFARWFPDKINRNLVFEPQELFSEFKQNISTVSYDGIGPIKFVIYGRPETPRNLFGLIQQAIEIFVNKYANHQSYEFISVGEKHSDIKLSGGYQIQSLGPLNYDNYAEVLKNAHIGISLMMSPHPSYPPLEMLNMGLITITNDFLGFKKPYLTSENLKITNLSAEDLANKIYESVNLLLSGDIQKSKLNSKLGNDLETVVKEVISLFPVV